jgi:RNA polymerase sigma-70 factor (ECF subfamily)
MDEMELVRKAQRGSLEAFNRLVKQHQDEIFQLVSALLADDPAAMQVTQAVFVKAFQRIDELRAGSPRDWLLGLALRCCRDYCQQGGRPARGLTALPTNLVGPLALVDLCGLDYQQAAAVLGMPVDEVSLRLAQARASLAHSAAPLREYA